MEIESLTILEHRLDVLVMDLANRYGIPYSIVRERCRLEVEELFKCWASSLNPFLECRLEQSVLEECVEELGDGYEYG